MSVELFPYDYFQQEFFKEGAVQGGPEAKEKCVDVALATKMLYFAALPSAYDVAILVTGDRDFVPVVQAVRNLGKRTMLATFTSLASCASILVGEDALGVLWDIPPLDLEPFLVK